jgi:hypothetical protein
VPHAEYDHVSCGRRVTIEAMIPAVITWLTAASAWRHQAATCQVPVVVVLSGHSPAGQVAVRAVGHERLVVPVFGSIWAPWSFWCIRVHKILPQAQMLPGKLGYLEYMS